MIRFAIVGTNWITRQFIDAAHETGAVKLCAVYSRSQAQAGMFSRDYPCEQTFTSLEAMIACAHQHQVVLFEAFKPPACPTSSG